MYLCIHLSVCLFNCLSAYLSVYLSIYLSIYRSIDLCIKSLYLHKSRAGGLSCLGGGRNELVEEDRHANLVCMTRYDTCYIVYGMLFWGRHALLHTACHAKLLSCHASCHAVAGAGRDESSEEDHCTSRFFCTNITS
jgi:hypothetical protein